MNTKRLLSILICILVLLSVAFLAGAGSDSAARMLSSMTTEQKIAQMLMLSFRYYTDSEGNHSAVTEVYPEMQMMLEKYGFAGVILFAQNTAENRQTLLLTDEIQKSNAKEGHPQLLICVDQEGGSVTRLAYGTALPGNMALGAAGDANLTKQAADIIGNELSVLGINMDAAPVLDVNNNPANPIIGLRSFSDDPDTVSRYGVYYMNALSNTGIIPTLKHFPGHGDTATDSHTGLPSINKSYDELKANELIPFKAAVDAGAEVIMTAHIQYPKIEKSRYKSISTGEEVYLPATLSKTILTDILREDMGFDGVIITDAMNMAAVQEHFDRIDAAKLAIEAGVDIILMPIDLSTVDGLGELEEYILTLASMVESGDISREKVDAAVLRVLRLKEAHGLLEPYDASESDSRMQLLGTIGSKAHHEIEWNMAKKAVTLVKNDNDMLPLITPGEKTVALTAYDNEVLSMEYAAERLALEGKLNGNISVYSIQKLSLEESLPLIADADHVVIISELYREAALNPDDTAGDYSAKLDALIDAAHKQGSDVAILSCYLPYDVARYQKADAIMTTLGARGMSESPLETEGAVKQYGPNIPAAFYLMFTENETPVGTLPVNIPILTNDFKYSDKILYQRGYGLQYNITPVFNDVHPQAWYYDAVFWAVNLHPRITNGTDPGKFSPLEGCTRAQIVSMLWRSMGCPKDDYPNVAFSDVLEDDYFADAVKWAAFNNIMNGTDPGIFSPYDVCTRGQVITMLFRLYSLDNELVLGNVNPFTDVPDNFYYTDAILWGVRNGMVRGISSTSFAPSSTCTRAEIVTLLYRMFNN